LRLVPEPFGPWEGRATVKINYIDEIRTLARQFRPNERNLTLYFPDFEAPPVPQSLNRVFGPPVGVTDELWPTYPRLRELLSPDSLAGWDPRDVRMEHVR
jgi:hypothetical protein